MHVGALLQPVHSTEPVLSGPPRAHPSGCVQPFRLRRAPPAPARALARRRASMASTVSLVPLNRRSKPILRTGFPLGVCCAKASLLSQGEAPLRPASPFGLRPHPFSPKLSRFRAGSFVAAEIAPAPRFSQSLLWGDSLQSRARRKPESGIPSKGFLWAQLFRSPATAFPRRRIFFNAHGESSIHFHSSSFILHHSRVPCRRLRKNSAAVASSLRSPAGQGIPAIGNQGFTFFTNALQLLGPSEPRRKRCLRVWLLRYPSACKPTCVWGPSCIFLIFTGNLKHPETVIV